MAIQSDFPPDTRVVSAANHDRKGTVIGNKLKASLTVAVEWDDGNLAKVNVNDILTEASLEDEFAAFQQEVNDKVQQAADLLLEANKLAASRGKNLQSTDDKNYDYLFDTGCIENAMEEAGWNTSSWHC